MSEHKCFDELVEKTGSDATFEKSFVNWDELNWNELDVKPKFAWIINLHYYTPGMNISLKRGKLIINFCPICGEDLRDE